MIFTNSRIDVLRRETSSDRDASDVLTCHIRRGHVAQMISERREGVPTGRLIAWCYECDAQIPHTPPPVRFTEAELKEVPRPLRPRKWPKREECAERNHAIRMAWATRRASKADLARAYDLTPTRIAQIIHGRAAARRASA